VQTAQASARVIEKRGVQIFVFILAAAAIVATTLVAVTYFVRFVRRRSDDRDASRTCMYFRRRRSSRFADDSSVQGTNLAPKHLSTIDPPPSVFRSPISDPRTAGLELSPDDEPEPFQDEPYQNEPYCDEPTLAAADPYRDEPILVNMGPPRDEDGNVLHNVDFL
jgi:hypothetical protein